MHVDDSCTQCMHTVHGASIKRKGSFPSMKGGLVWWFASLFCAFSNTQTHSHTHKLTTNVNGQAVVRQSCIDGVTEAFSLWSLSCSDSYFWPTGEKVTFTIQVRTLRFIYVFLCGSLIFYGTRTNMPLHKTHAFSYTAHACVNQSSSSHQTPPPPSSPGWTCGLTQCR